MTDVDYQLECLAWLRSTRGDEFVDELQSAVAVHGARAALAGALHPGMSDGEREAIGAVVEFLAATECQPIDL